MWGTEGEAKEAAGKGNGGLTLSNGAHVDLAGDVKVAIGLDTFGVADGDVAQHIVIEVRSVTLGMARRGTLRLRSKRAGWRAEAQGAVLVRHENACIGCGVYVDVNVNEGRDGDEGAYTHSR